MWNIKSSRSSRLLLLSETFHMQKHLVCEWLEISLSTDWVNFAQRHLAELFCTSKSRKHLFSKSWWLCYCKKCKQQISKLLQLCHVTVFSHVSVSQSVRGAPTHWYLPVFTVSNSGLLPYNDHAQPATPTWHHSVSTMPSQPQLRRPLPSPTPLWS